ALKRNIRTDRLILNDALRRPIQLGAVCRSIRSTRPSTDAQGPGQGSLTFETDQMLMVNLGDPRQGSNILRVLCDRALQALCARLQALCARLQAQHRLRQYFHGLGKGFVTIRQAIEPLINGHLSSYASLVLSNML